MKINIKTKIKINYRISMDINKNINMKLNLNININMKINKKQINLKPMNRPRIPPTCDKKSKKVMRRDLLN